MYTKSSYTKLTENRIDKNEKKNNWEIAIGLNEVDNLKPSKYLIELMQDSIEGKKSYKEVENALYSYYKELDPNDEAILQTEECDLVSVRIVQLLENGSFKFSPITLKTIHRFGIKKWFLERGFILGIDASLLAILISVMLFTAKVEFFCYLIGGIYIFEFIHRSIELYINIRLEKKD